MPDKFWEKICIKVNGDGKNIDDYRLPEGYRQIPTDEFKFFVEKILAAVNPKQNNFRRNKTRKTLSNIFSVSDETFALLMLLNEEKVWQKKRNNDGKPEGKRFTGSRDGEKYGWSLMGRQLYTSIHSQLKELRKRKVSQDVETKMLDDYKIELVNSTGGRRQIHRGHDYNAGPEWDAMETVPKDNPVYKLLTSVTSI